MSVADNIFINYEEFRQALFEMKEAPIEGRETKAKIAEKKAMEKAYANVLEYIKCHPTKAIPIFCEEIDRKVSRHVLDNCTAGSLQSDGMIGWETLGAKATFAVGEPMFDAEGKFLGRLTFGFFDHLDYSIKDRCGKNVPVEFWKIDGYKGEYIPQGQLLTYYQYVDRFINKKDETDK